MHSFYLLFLSAFTAPVLAESFSAWGHVEAGPPDAILGIAQNFRECTDSRKVNVCVGAYRDENGKSWVLPSVRRAEELMLKDDEVKDYLPIGKKNP